MSTLVFAGVTLKNWQTPRKSLTRATKETELLSENTHVARSSRVVQFPKIFQCRTETDEEMMAVEALINADYSTLTIDGVNYSDCYVYQIFDIWEMVEESGVWSYSIEFRKADVY